MSQKASGQVYKIFSNPYQGKNLYSIKLDGDDTYYGTGEKEPPVQPGDNVSLEFTVNAKGRATAVFESITKLEPTPEQTKATTKGGNKGGENWQARGEYWAAKEAHDLEMEPEYRFRNAVSKAIEFVSLAEQAKCLPLNKSAEGDTTAAKKKRFDAVWALVLDRADALAMEMAARKGVEPEPPVPMEDFKANVTGEEDATGS